MFSSYPAFFEEDPAPRDVPDKILRENLVPSSTPSQSLTFTQRWLLAIHAATQVLHDRHPALADMQISKPYLAACQQALLAKEDCWDQPPKTSPPKYPAAWKDTSSVVHAIDGSSMEASMVQRRILIRVTTAQSELDACHATSCRYATPRCWLQGAQLYGSSLQHIHEAIQLADSEICRLLQTQQYDASNAALEEDAFIVEVAIGHLTAHRGRYAKAAYRQAAKIRHSLQMEREKRDLIKKRMGDQWYQPRPPRVQNRYTAPIGNVAPGGNAAPRGKIAASGSAVSRGNMASSGSAVSRGNMASNGSAVSRGNAASSDSAVSKGNAASIGNAVPSSKPSQTGRHTIPSGNALHSHHSTATTGIAPQTGFVAPMTHAARRAADEAQLRDIESALHALDDLFIPEFRNSGVFAAAGMENESVASSQF